MKKIFLVYGHYNENSFNAAIKNEFIKHSELKGNKVDVVDLYKEKFDPVFAGEDPSAEVLDHRKRIEECDTIVLVAPIWNCLLYTSPSPRDLSTSRMPSSA